VPKQLACDLDTDTREGRLRLGPSQPRVVSSRHRGRCEQLSVSIDLNQSGTDTCQPPNRFKGDVTLMPQNDQALERHACTRELHLASVPTDAILDPEPAMPDEDAYPVAVDNDDACLGVN
jgi:hypothetical protein